MTVLRYPLATEKSVGFIDRDNVITYVVDYRASKTQIAKEFEELAAQTMAARAAMGAARWVPTIGPQADAYHSSADVLLFGGEPGGGKTELGLGLAFNCHKRSLLLRRQYTDLSGLTDGAIRINGSRDGFNGSSPPRLTVGEGQFLDFGACARPGDEQNWMGRPTSLISSLTNLKAESAAEAILDYIVGT